MATPASYSTFIKIGSDTIQVKPHGSGTYNLTERIEYFTRVGFSASNPEVIVLYRARHLVTSGNASLSVYYANVFNEAGSPIGGTPQAVLDAITAILETTSTTTGATSANQVLEIAQLTAANTKLQTANDLSAALNESWGLFTALLYNELGRGPAVDAFSTLRVSQKLALLDLNHRYNKQPLLVDEKLTSGATSVHLPTESSVRMSVTTTVGSRVVRQTKEYFKYQAGKSQLIMMTGVMIDDSSKLGIRSRIGYFDDAADKVTGVIDGNGVYFERDETGAMYIVLRSYITGAQVNTRVAQQDWNYDTFDGNGPSGITLDFDRAQIFLMDLEWLGVGTIRFGFAVNGGIFYAHYYHNANIINSVYMTTAALPIRYEIEQVTGVVAGNMKMICATVNSEAGFNPRGQIFAASRGVVTPVIVGATELPIISIRLQAAYNRATINPIDVSVLTSTTGNMLYRVRLNPTLTNAAFAAPNPFCFAEIDTAATATTGGTELREFYNSGDLNSLVSSFENVLKVFSNIAGTSDILTLTAQKIGAGTENIYGSFQWQEYV